MSRDTAVLAASLTIWSAVLAWAVAEWQRSARGASAVRGRALWTLGALAAIVHAGLALHVHHGWSHAAALADTAARTAAVVGWSSGSGLYVNFAFLVVWAADALWWWLAPRSFTRRPRVLDRAVRGFLWFLFVNGAFVFAAAPQRWLGLAAVLAVPVAWYRPGSRP